MLSAKSESDITSLAPSSPSRSPKRPVYYVQSPSRDSRWRQVPFFAGHSNLQQQPYGVPFSPVFRAPLEELLGQPVFRSSSGRKGARKRNDKGCPECNVIMEEGAYDELQDKAFTRRFQALIALFGFVLLFTTLCLIIWGASRPYKAEVTMKSLAVNNLYVGEGSDSTGVPTKMLTVTGSLKMNIYNPLILGPNTITLLTNSFGTDIRVVNLSPQEQVSFFTRICTRV